MWCRVPGPHGKQGKTRLCPVLVIVGEAISNLFKISILNRLEKYAINTVFYIGMIRIP
jgi:hypothetical protein